MKNAYYLMHNLWLYSYDCSAFWTVTGVSYFHGITRNFSMTDLAKIIPNKYAYINDAYICDEESKKSLSGEGLWIIKNLMSLTT